MEPSSSSEIRNSSELTPLLNTERARERLSSDTASSSENFHRRDMENAIQLDRWLREYDVQLEID